MTTVTGEMAVMLDVLGYRNGPGLRNDVLEMVMVRTQPDSPDATYGRYPRPAALIEGLAATATRAEVAAFLGAPERVGPSFDRYEVNDRYLHFEFDSSSRVARVSALLEPS